MTDVAIRVENLGKKYQLGVSKSVVSTRGSFRESLSTLFRRTENGKGTPSSEFWTLKDITLEIRTRRIHEGRSYDNYWLQWSSLTK